MVEPRKMLTFIEKDSFRAKLGSQELNKFQYIYYGIQRKKDAFKVRKDLGILIKFIRPDQ